MNLTDIQLELRNIEDKISKLHSEIEKIKPKTDEEKKTDYEAITKMALKHPIMNSKLKEATDYVKKVFISSLSYILLTEDEDIYTRLLYLCRLANGCGYKVTAKEIYKSGIEFEIQDIEELCKELWEFKYIFLTEAFIIANLSQNKPIKMLTLISEIAIMLGCEKDDIKVIAQVAKSYLMKDMEQLKNILLKSENTRDKWFQGYIPQEWIVNSRIECGVLCIEKYLRLSADARMGMSNNFMIDNIYDYEKRRVCAVVKTVQSGSRVKKGDMIISYTEKVKRDSVKTISDGASFIEECWENYEHYEKVERKIIAPKDGIVYFIGKEKSSRIKGKKDTYLNIYVVSYLDDYKDFYNWVKKQ